MTDQNLSHLSENKQRMARGDLYHAFTPELTAERERCRVALNAFNDARDVTRRNLVRLWRNVVLDERPMPPVLANAEADAEQFDATDPWVMPPQHCDYGTQVEVAAGTFVNFNASFIDTSPIRIGARVLIGPNCSFYSGGHPLDPAVRNGTQGPEWGKAIVIEEDCWLGGGVHVLPGVTIGRGSTVGAGSVVTRDVPPFTVVAGNPARHIRKIQSELNPNPGLETGPSPAEHAIRRNRTPASDQRHGVDLPMAAMAQEQDDAATKTLRLPPSQASATD